MLRVGDDYSLTLSLALGGRRGLIISHSSSPNSLNSITKIKRVKT